MLISGVCIWVTPRVGAVWVGTGLPQQMREGGQVGNICQLYNCKSLALRISVLCSMLSLIRKYLVELNDKVKLKNEYVIFPFETLLIASHTPLSSP